jgi:hypothetical protein
LLASAPPPGSPQAHPSLRGPFVDPYEYEAMPDDRLAKIEEQIREAIEERREVIRKMRAFDECTDDKHPDHWMCNPRKRRALHECTADKHPSDHGMCIPEEQISYIMELHEFLYRWAHQLPAEAMPAVWFFEPEPHPEGVWRAGWLFQRVLGGPAKEERKRRGDHHISRVHGAQPAD